MDSDKALVTRRCEKCSAVLTAPAPMQRYCPSCAAAVTREGNRIRQRNHRQRHPKPVVRKSCEVCGIEIPNVRNKKYCDGCNIEVRRRNKRDSNDRLRKTRKAVRSYSGQAPTQVHIIESAAELGKFELVVIRKSSRVAIPLSDRDIIRLSSQISGIIARRRPTEKMKKLNGL